MSYMRFSDSDLYLFCIPTIPIQYQCQNCSLFDVDSGPMELFNISNVFEHIKDHIQNGDKIDFAGCVELLKDYLYDE